VNPTELAVAWPAVVWADEHEGWQARQMTGLALWSEKTRSSWLAVTRIRSPVTSSAETGEAPTPMIRRSAVAAS
jgi:hypothetical protein